MDKLTKLSLIICLIGLISLFFVSQSGILKLDGINNATEENLGKEIMIKGKLKNIQIYDKSVLMNIKTECYVNAFYYDKDGKIINLNDTNIFLNKNITLSGTIDSAFYPQINVKSFEIE